MRKLINKQNRLIYKLLSENPTLEKVSFVNFEFKHKLYKFKLYLLSERYNDWYIELWKVGSQNDIKLGGLSCNAGHKKGLVLMGELLIRRYLGGNE